MKITLKDGSYVEFEGPMSIIGIAESISAGLARVACAGRVNGEVMDLRTVLTEDAALEILTANDIPHAILQNWEEILADPQANAADVFYEMHYPTGAVRKLVRQPVFVGSELPDYPAAPLLGENSEEVIRGLGYSDEEMRAMHEAGVYNTWDDLKGAHGY